MHCSRWLAHPYYKASYGMGSLASARTTEARMKGRRPLENPLGQYCLSQEKVLPTGLLAYFWVAVNCSLILRAKFQVEFKQIRLNTNQ